jgi:hypothetical protein
MVGVELEPSVRECIIPTLPNLAIHPLFTTTTKSNTPPFTHPTNYHSPRGVNTTIVSSLGTLKVRQVNHRGFSGSTKRRS